VGAFSDVFSLGETMKCFSNNVFPRCLNPALDKLSAEWMSYAETLKAPLTENRPSVNDVSEQMIMFAQMASAGNGINYVSGEISKELNRRANGSGATYLSVEESEPYSAASIDVAALLIPLEGLSV
jgi:hypothetical protein